MNFLRDIRGFFYDFCATQRGQERRESSDSSLLFANLHYLILLGLFSFAKKSFFCASGKCEFFLCASEFKGTV